jgi:hypothetical protein
MLKTTLITTLSMLVGFSNLYAQEAPNTDVNSSASIVEDVSPKYWWKQGSYDYPATDKLLIHIDGTLAYSKSEGNLDTQDNIYTVNAKIRKNHIGISFTYFKKYAETTIHDPAAGDTTTIIDEYSSSILLGYDINEDFFTVLGYDNARDTAFEIYNQTTQYVGLGYRFKHEKHRLNFFAAVGTEDVSFGTYPKLPSGKTTGQFYQFNYNALIFDDVKFELQYSYFNATEVYRNTSKLYASISIPIYDVVSLTVGYKEDYIEAQDLADRFNTDKTFYTGLRIDF